MHVYFGSTGQKVWMSIQFDHHVAKLHWFLGYSFWLDEGINGSRIYRINTNSFCSHFWTLSPTLHFFANNSPCNPYLQNNTYVLHPFKTIIHINGNFRKFIGKHFQFSVFVIVNYVLKIVKYLIVKTIFCIIYFSLFPYYILLY